MGRGGGSRNFSSGAVENSERRVSRGIRGRFVDKDNLINQYVIVYPQTFFKKSEKSV